jgi:nucleotide-binding universal stress UspA family protein
MMGYATLMVHVSLSSSNDAVLRVAATLAEQFKAHVIGVAACRPIQISYGDGYASGDLLAAQQTEIENDMKAAEASFRTALEGKASGLEWRSAVSFEPLAGFATAQARAADLVVTGPSRGGSPFNASASVDIGDLVMSVGRPVLVVPPNIEALELNHAMLGWKESRETRRVATDALPLLKKAARVTVVEIVPEDGLASAQDRLQDVAGWFKRHGIAAEPLAVVAGRDDAAQLDAIAQENQVDLLVAGAYGHNRLREWMLGGVTYDLLLQPSVCSLLSH